MAHIYRITCITNNRTNYKADGEKDTLEAVENEAWRAINLAGKTGVWTVQIFNPSTKRWNTYKEMDLNSKSTQENVIMEDESIFVPEFPNQYTKKEIDILNMEVTPEIEEILNQLLLEKAREEAETNKPLPQGPDLDRELINHISLFEQYIAITKEREPLQQRWENIRVKRSLWWSFFKEEMDYNWMNLDLFDQKFDRLVEGYIKAGMKPTKAEWTAIKQERSRVYRSCMSVQQSRRNHTYKIYLKADAATLVARAFWGTKEGKQLSELNKERAMLWDLIQELNVTWEDYNNLVNTEFSPYWTNGDTEEVDDMELMARNTWETMEILEESHQEEMRAYNMPESTAKGFWSYKEEYKSKAIKGLEAAEDAYFQSLVDYVEDNYSKDNNKEDCSANL